jgi:hypothetical protein
LVMRVMCLDVESFVPGQCCAPPLLNHPDADDAPWPWSQSNERPVHCRLDHSRWRCRTGYSRTLALCTKVESTTFFLRGWCWKGEYKQRPVRAGLLYILWARRAIRFPVNINVEKGKVAISLSPWWTERFGGHYSAG